VTGGPYGETESDLPDVPEWVNPTEGEDPGPAPSAAAGDPPRADDEDHGGVDGEWEEEWDDRLDVERVGRYRDWDRSPHTGRRILVALAVLVVAVIVLAVGAVVWVNGHLNGTGGAPQQVTLPAQAGHATLASDLTRAGVVSNDWLFKHYLDYRDLQPVAGGQYTFHHGEGYRAALHDLDQGPKVVQVRLTIPEGYDLAEIAAAVGKLPGLSAQKFLQVAQSGAVRSQFEPANSNNLEGLVFPDTYFVDPGESEQDILQTMVSRFDQIAGGVNLANSQATNGLTPYQTIIAASIIEKEAKVPGDRGKIARVIVNRLAAGMKLQIDATVDYALGVHKTRLTDADLATKSPYNTYLVAGLPPGPIASPGQASLQAALNPTPGTWLYYVLIDPDGQQGFATTPAQFNQLLSEAHAKGLI
jgi:peptidoglycan lytic transglycosylase G